MGRETHHELTSMPRKSRKRAPVESPATESTPASEPAQIAGALDEVIHKAGLVTADQLPAVEKRFVEPKPDLPPPPEKPSLPNGTELRISRSDQMT